MKKFFVNSKKEEPEAENAPEKITQMQMKTEEAPDKPDKTIENLDRTKCTGCGACYNKCPECAIKMEYDSEGFIFPYVSHENCINCGLCMKVCPELNTERTESLIHEEGECYAMMADDELRMKSSSGGMFTLIAEWVLDRGGAVCGAEYTSDYMGVQHSFVYKKKDLERLRGSKYVQSDTKDTYSKTEELLKAGRKVLFTGCPCQVAGLYSFLGKDYENLCTADLVCHGAPSPKVYKKYIEEKSRGRKLSKVDFREKAFWGWGTATSFFYEDGSAFRADCFKDEYWRGFLGGLETRRCCGECRYAQPDRVGDFTLGDFWGADEIDKSLSDGRGTSLVKVNSDKAVQLQMEIQKKCMMFEKTDREKVLKLAETRNGQLLHPTQSHWARSRFFELLDEKPFVQAFDWAINSNYDVGILGWWYNENYGGALTYFALHQVLRKMGLSVLMVAKCSWDKNYEPQYNSIPYRFAQKNYHISKNYTPENISSLNNHCKTFISGSDQLFNPTLWEYSGPEYFLDFASPENNIVSYASSFGNGFVDIGNLKIRMSYWLNRFDALSVRESYGVDICRDVFGLEAVKVMDPVFLCDVSEYEKQAEKSGLKKESEYVLSFILDPDDEKSRVVRNVSKKLGMSMVNLMNASDLENNAKRMALDNMKPGIDLEEWLFWYKNADFVITDSFHGTCFAIIFRKKFISLANFQRGEKRFISLLQEMGLMDHLVYDLKEIENNPALFEDINYDEVYSGIAPNIKASYEWLENAVKKPKKKEINIFNTLNCEIERLNKKIKKLEDKLK